MHNTTNSRAPVIDGAAHAWVVDNSQFSIDPDVATCPQNMPAIDESAEHLLARMATFGIDNFTMIDITRHD